MNADNKCKNVEKKRWNKQMIALRSSLTVNMFLCLLIFCLLFSANCTWYSSWETGRYHYSHAGFSEDISGAGLLVCGVEANKNDTGHCCYDTTPAHYGVHTWTGQHMGKTSTGWTLQGLTDGDCCEYVAFEWIRPDIYRCITYDKHFTTEQPTISLEDLDQITLLYNQDWTTYHRYTIIWEEDSVIFLIDDVIVAMHTKVIPEDNNNVMMHIHAAVAPWMAVPETNISSMITCYSWKEMR